MFSTQGGLVTKMSLSDHGRCHYCNVRLPRGELKRFQFKFFCIDHIGTALEDSVPLTPAQSPLKGRSGIAKGGSSLKQGARLQRAPVGSGGNQEKKGLGDSGGIVRTSKPLDKKLREEVMDRDSHRCRMCGRSGESNRLDPHHVIYKSMGGKDEMGNLITLCFRCHVPIVHQDRKRWQPVCIHALETGSLKRLPTVEKEMLNAGD